MEFKIRSANPNEANVLCGAEKFWASRPGHLVSSPEELRVESFARKIDELSRDPKGRYVVAEDDNGKILGHALLDPMGLKSLEHIVRLTIVIHPGCDGKGVGKKIMEHLITWAKNTAGVEKIELLVRSSNLRAIDLYNKFGFIEEGRLVRRIKIDDKTYIDDITMGLLTK